MQMKLSIEKITAIVCFIIICALSISSALTPAIEFSENENRYLAKFPKISVKSILSKKYMEELEDYTCDQFAMRDGFMSMYALYSRAIGKTEINQVYLAKDGYLIEKYKEPTHTEKIIERWNRFFEKSKVKADVMLVPTAISIYEDKLPPFAKPSIQREVWNTYNNRLNANMINVWDALSEEKDKRQLYYKTDHHWTTYGAYVAYRQYCMTKDITPFEWEALNPKTVTKQFRGTCFSKVNDSGAPKDSIERILPKDWEDCLTVNYSRGITSNSLYAPEYLGQKDKYSYFLNNLNDKIEIHNNNCKNGKTLLVVKDSYANCFVPFLVNHYENIVVLDTRYYMTGVSQYIKNNPVSDVLILYNLNTLDEDTGTRGIY